MLYQQNYVFLSSKRGGLHHPPSLGAPLGLLHISRSSLNFSMEGHITPEEIAFKVVWSAKTKMRVQYSFLAAQERLGAKKGIFFMVRNVR